MSGPTMPPGYRRQNVPDGCWNCGHCLDESFNGTFEGCCAFLPPPPPPTLDELIGSEAYRQARTPEERHAVTKPWHDWSRGRDVYEFGICDEWRKKR